MDHPIFYIEKRNRYFSFIFPKYSLYLKLLLLEIFYIFFIFWIVQYKLPYTSVNILNVYFGIINYLLIQSFFAIFSNGILFEVTQIGVFSDIDYAKKIINSLVFYVQGAAIWSVLTGKTYFDTRQRKTDLKVMESIFEKGRLANQIILQALQYSTVGLMTFW